MMTHLDFINNRKYFVSISLRDLLKNVLIHFIYKVINECDNQICQNDGTCEDLDGLSRWRCNCLPGFTGIHCETGKYEKQKIDQRTT